jgi:hypothetical protein
MPVRIGGADLFELRRLVAIGDAEVAQAPGLAALLESRVVQVAVVGQQPHRATLLRARRVGTQLVGASRGRPHRTPHLFIPARRTLPPPLSSRTRRATSSRDYRATVGQVSGHATASIFVSESRRS